MAICFVSCSDKDETIVCPIKNFTFTDVSGLALTYSGKPMLGKKVEFIPDAADAERDKKDYEVKLSNRTELKFDLKFNLIDIDF